MSTSDMLTPFTRSWLHIPLLAAGLVLGLLLMFFKDLDLGMRTALVPALAVYLIGNSIIAYIYHDLDARNCVKAIRERQEPSPQPQYVFVLVVIAYALWFGLLVGYLLFKGVL
jgi:hypothetical protein